jgi:hypothetical protein
MAHIPRTQKKLRETQFFMSKLMQEAGSENLDREDFSFYLSAFLTAGRSVRDVLKKENSASYTWCRNWEKALSPGEQRLLRFMQKQRNMEVHELGAKTQDDVSMVPLAHSHTHSPLLGVFLDEGSWIGQKVYYVTFNGKKEKAVDVCTRYLDLLVRLVNGFGHAFP